MTRRPIKGESDRAGCRTLLCDASGDASLGLTLGAAWSEAAPTFPPSTGRVVDQANVLSPRNARLARGRLKALEDKSGIHSSWRPSLRWRARRSSLTPTTSFRAWKLGERRRTMARCCSLRLENHKVRIEVAMARGDAEMTRRLKSHLQCDRAALQGGRFRRRRFARRRRHCYHPDNRRLRLAENGPKFSRQGRFVNGEPAPDPYLLCDFSLFHFWRVVRHGGWAQRTRPGIDERDLAAGVIRRRWFFGRGRLFRAAADRRAAAAPRGAGDGDAAGGGPHRGGATHGAITLQRPDCLRSRVRFLPLRNHAFDLERLYRSGNTLAAADLTDLPAETYFHRAARNLSHRARHSVAAGLAATSDAARESRSNTHRAADRNSSSSAALPIAPNATGSSSMCRLPSATHVSSPTTGRPRRSTRALASIVDRLTSQIKTGAVSDALIGEDRCGDLLAQHFRHARPLGRRSSDSICFDPVGVSSYEK